MSSIRIGHGYDVHKLVNGRKLILGGVMIEHEKGLLGHSDADVLTHAIIDSLLGAAGLGDIGLHFPDSNDLYKDCNSIELLKAVLSLLHENQYSVGNIDCTVVAQAPKLRTYIDKMQENIAKACFVSKESINIKATTEEGLGFTGEKQGISAHSVCIIEKV